MFSHPQNLFVRGKTLWVLSEVLELSNLILVNHYELSIVKTKPLPLGKCLVLQAGSMPPPLDISLKDGHLIT